MSYQIERPSPCQVVVSATVPPAQVREEREHVLSGIGRQARVPGFRPGKAPRAMVERRYADEIRGEVEEHLLRHTWQEIREGEKLRPATPLGVRRVTWNDDGSVVLEGELEVYPSVELVPHEGFVPPPFDCTPTGEEVDKALAALQDRQSTWEPVEEGVVEEGHLVEVEVWGSFPKGEREPFHEERSLFVLGDHEVFPEFETAVRGHRAGDEVAARREASAGEGDEATPLVVDYRIVIKSLRRKRRPELDDAFATSLGVEGGLAALRERVEVDLGQQKQRARFEQWRDALLAHLTGGRQLDLPATPVEEETRKEMQEFVHSLVGRGVDPEKAQLDWPKVELAMRARVEARMRAELVLDALAEQLHIAVGEGEVNREVQRQATRMDVPFAELKGNLSKSGGLGRVAAIMRRDKAVERVLQPHLQAAGA